MTSAVESRRGEPLGVASRPSRRLDLRLYLVTSGTDRRTVEAAAAAAAAGAGVVQVRAKDLPTRQLLELVRTVADAVRAVRPETTVLVDDRADVAFAARAAGAHVHGVHLGAEDLPAEAARALLGPGAVVGLTTGTRELVEAANRYVGVADYVGAGPYRETPTKRSGRPPLGVGGYRELVAVGVLPIVAIGDIRVEDVAALRATGVAGVAVVREIMAASDPGARAAQLLAAWSGQAMAGGGPPE